MGCGKCGDMEIGGRAFLISSIVGYCFNDILSGLFCKFLCIEAVLILVLRNKVLYFDLR